MVSEELIGYIRSSRKAGFSDQAIKAMLERSGYPADVIDTGFEEAEQSDSAEKKPPFYHSEVVGEDLHEEKHDTGKSEHIPGKGLTHRVEKEVREPPEGVFSRLGMVTRYPADFFESLSLHEQKPYRALSQYLLVAGIVCLVWFGAFYGASVFSEEIKSYELAFAGYLLAAIAVIVLAPVVSIIWHLFIMVVGGSGRMGNSLQVALYSYMPFIATSWLPGVNFATLVGTCVFLFKGLKKIHGLGAVSALVLMALFQILLAICAVLVIIGAQTLLGL